jgi:hypothetical protein
MLLWWNIDTSDTSHFDPLNSFESALTLLVTGVSADHTNHTLTTDNFTVTANFLDRS